MPNTRTFSLSLYEEIKLFKDNFYNESTLQSIGWKPVPIIDVQGASNWSDVMTEFNEQGVNKLINNGWMKLPVAITNHELFKIDTCFLNDVENISNANQFREIVDNYYTLPSTVINNCRESRIYQTHSCPDFDLNEHSFSVSFSMLNLCTFSIPESLTFTNFDALFQFNPYYTDGHVETGGKDSISYTPVGEKLFIISNHGKESVLLERQLRSVKNFIQFVKSGPDTYKHSMYYYIPNKSHFLCQPALCAHAVLTFTTGPSLVLGWEANTVNDTSRAQETLSNYGNGLQNNAFKSLVIIHGIKGATEWSSFRDKQHGKNSGITEHLQSYASSGQNVVITTSTSKRGRPAGPSKNRKRSFFLPGQKAKYEEKRNKETGKI